MRSDGCSDPQMFSFHNIMLIEIGRFTELKQDDHPSCAMILGLLLRHYASFPNMLSSGLVAKPSTGMYIAIRLPREIY